MIELGKRKTLIYLFNSIPIYIPALLANSEVRCQSTLYVAYGDTGFPYLSYQAFLYFTHSYRDNR
jgi:hypothetical protein